MADTYTVITKRTLTYTKADGSPGEKTQWTVYGIYNTFHEARQETLKLNNKKGKAQYSALIYKTSTLQAQGLPSTTDMTNT